MNLGDKIRMLRESREISRKGLAEASNLDQSTIGKCERGVIEPSLQIIKQLAGFFAVPVDYFLSDINDVGETYRIVKKVPVYSVPVSAGNGVFLGEIVVVGHIPVIRSDIDYAVRVVGDSMEPVAPAGSILLVKKDLPMSGDMVICTYDGMIYCKWFIRQGEQITLVSEKPAYAPIVVRPNEKFETHGVVVDIMRGQKPRKVLRRGM